MSANGWPEILPGHLSFTSLTQYHRCPEQFRERVILGRKEPPKGFLVWGSAHDAALTHNFTQKIDSHEDVPVSEVKDRFASSVDEQLDTFGGESQIEWGRSSAAETKDLGVELVAAYQRVAAPSVQPVAVQEKIEIPIPGVPVPLIGYLDVTTENAIIEEKTAGRKWSVPEGNYVAQARIYQLARPLPVHWHVATKTKTPGIYTPAQEKGLVEDWSLESKAWTEAWVQRTVRAILATLAEFGPDEPWPDARARHDSPCSWCGYKPMCPAWVKPLPVF